MVKVQRRYDASEKNTHELLQALVVNASEMMTRQLDHFLQEVIDLVLSATEVSTLDKVVGLLSPSPSWVVQLEGPQEVGGVLEVWSNGEDLMDQILNTDDSHLAQLVLNDVVGGDWSSVSIDLN